MLKGTGLGTGGRSTPMACIGVAARFQQVPVRCKNAELRYQVVTQLLFTEGFVSGTICS